MTIVFRDGQFIAEREVGHVDRRFSYRNDGVRKLK